MRRLFFSQLREIYELYGRYDVKAIPNSERSTVSVTNMERERRGAVIIGLKCNEVWIEQRRVVPPSLNCLPGTRISRVNEREVAESYPVSENTSLPKKEKDETSTRKFSFPYP